MCEKEFCKAAVCLKCIGTCMCIDKHDKKGAYLLFEVMLCNNGCKILCHSGWSFCSCISLHS